MPGKRFGERTEARSQALQLLFQAQMTGRLVSDVLASGDYVLVSDLAPDGECVYYDGPLGDFARDLAQGADGMLHALDRVLDEASTNWGVSRMTSVDRTLLRLAVYEMAMVDDVDVPVSINEYVDIAKAYGTDESSRFVNGLLGRIARMLEAGEVNLEPDAEVEAPAALDNDDLDVADAYDYQGAYDDYDDEDEGDDEYYDEYEDAEGDYDDESDAYGDDGYDDGYGDGYDDGYAEDELGDELDSDGYADADDELPSWARE